jgi:N-acyl homoserine lactone hydrolase
LEIDSMMTFEEALESVHLTPDRIDIVIQTHLHFDHCYNTRKCTRAKVVVQESELAFARNPAPFGGLYRRDLYEGLNFEVVRGDTRIAEGIDLLSVPGHSAGGQAVRVSTEKGNVLISGLCGIQENFHPRNPHPMAGEGQVVLPGIMLDALKAFNSIIRMKELGDTILPLHDPEILNMKSIP